LVSWWVIAISMHLHEYLWTAAAWPSIRMQLHGSKEYFAGMQRPSDATERAYVRLMRAQQAVLSGIEAALKRAGLPPLSWYDVLLELKREESGRASPGRLQGAMLLEQYNLSRLLDRMQAEGLIRRVPCPEDRRRQFVEITGQGRALQKRMWPVYAAAIQAEVGDKLTDEQAERLAALLASLTPETCRG
jgi:DNA-binding MarR family transcriptional regulator